VNASAELDAIKRIHPRRGAGILKSLSRKDLRPSFRVRRAGSRAPATKFAAPRKIFFVRFSRRKALRRKHLRQLFRAANPQSQEIPRRAS
jgi:hypothetical protein